MALAVDFSLDAELDQEAEAFAAVLDAAGGEEASEPPLAEPLPPEPSVWADWLCSLMERGVVPKPHPSQVDAVIEKTCS